MAHRDIVIGDVHGCIDELNELLALVGYSPSDNLVFAGDLVDKGPASAAVVRRVRELGARSVMGNHDEWYARFAKREASGRNMMKRDEDRLEIYRALSPADLEWLIALPPYIYLDDHIVVVHAGFRPGLPVAEQDVDDCLRMRYVRRATGERWNFSTDEELLTPSAAAYWTEVWDGRESVVYGHHPSKSNTITTVTAGGMCWGIDTGCCFGNRLTAWVRSSYRDLGPADIRFVSVPARAQYVSWHKSMSGE